MSRLVSADWVRLGFDQVAIDDLNDGLPTLAIVSAWWNRFSAIWWDIGLVATPAKQILAAASVAHDAVDEWRAEFPFLLHDVPCCFRITRHTWSRAVDARAHWARKNPGFKRDVRNTLRAWERKEWPALPGRNDYRGNVCDTAWLQDAWTARWNSVIGTAVESIAAGEVGRIEIRYAAESTLGGMPPAGSWRDMQPNALPPPGDAPNCRCTINFEAHFTSTVVADSVRASQARLNAFVRHAIRFAKKTPRQRLDRAGKQRRKRGRR